MVEPRTVRFEASGTRRCGLKTTVSISRSAPEPGCDRLPFADSSKRYEYELGVCVCVFLLLVWSLSNEPGRTEHLIVTDEPGSHGMALIMAVSVLSFSVWD